MTQPQPKRSSGHSSFATSIAILAAALGTFFFGKAEATQLMKRDHAILWPLKTASNTLGGESSVFGMKGDGFCNTIPLDEIIPPSLFNEVAKAMFNSDGKTCVVDTDFADQYAFSAPGELLEPGIPLIKVKGISPNACDQSLWKVVAMRLDPCNNLPKHRNNGEACTSQLRLVAQPFESAKNGFTTAMGFQLSRGLQRFRFNQHCEGIERGF